MTGPITWEAIAYLVGIASVLGGAWWAVHVRITTLKERVEQVRAHSARDLDAFKLMVSERYIRAEDLDKIEKRLIDSESRMTKAFETLTARIDALVERLPVKNSRT